MKVLLALIFFVLAVACSRAQSNGDGSVPVKNNDVRLSGLACPEGRGALLRVQLEQLLAHGDRYDGRIVLVTGYYSHSFEHSAIYATQQLDPYQRHFRDGIWVNGLSPFVDGNGQEILVSGVFSSKGRGHGGQWSGSVCANYVAVRSRGSA